MPHLVVVGEHSLWPRGWRLDPFEVHLVSGTSVGSAGAPAAVVVVARTFEAAVAATNAAAGLRGDEVARLLACHARMERVEELLTERDFDGCIDLAWPEGLVRAALGMARRQVDLGRNIVEIQRVVLAQSRDEAATLRELAGHDELTHLSNRRNFSELVVRVHERCRRLERPYALVFIDVDDLKLLNSRWGHAGGSKALSEVGNLLSASVRGADIAARIGGDEFVVVLDGCTEEGAMEFARRLCSKIKDHVFEVDGRPASMSVSAGVAAFPQHAQTYLELMQHADQALFEAKSLGKGRALGFDARARPSLPDALAVGSAIP
jgi:diguanylate cyclase (GGDEF)-like protein